MNSIKNNLVKNLSFYLEERNMTQKELAIKLDVAQSSVTNWVKGNNTPDLDMITEICETLKVSPGDLLGINENDQYSNIEKKIIYNYRNKIELQKAVKLILGITED